MQSDQNSFFVFRLQVLFFPRRRFLTPRHPLPLRLLDVGARPSDFLWSPDLPGLNSKLPKKKS
jgi:hypothetical protein